MLREFGREIWTANGSEVVAMLGFSYPTRMAVKDLPAGDLLYGHPLH